MLRAHRQAWCWQDEYYGLELSDIRRLEHETQLALQQTMAGATEENQTECDTKPTNKTVENANDNRASPNKLTPKQNSFDQVRTSEKSHKNLSPSSSRHSTRSRSTNKSLQSARSKTSIGEWIRRALKILK